MHSIVVHYKELALKGKNRPWFIQHLVRNLRAALAGLDVKSVRSVTGRIEIDLGAGTQWEAASARIRRVFGIANFSFAGRASHDFDEMAAAILGGLGDRRPGSFRVSARRSDKRFPFTSPQIERQVGGLIQEATGWRVDLEHAELTIHIEMMPDHCLLLFRQGAGRRRIAERHQRQGGVPVVGRLRLAGRRVPHDAARLLGSADSLPQLSDSVARVAGESARDRGAAHAVAAPLAPAARALRRAAAAGGPRRQARAARRHLPPADAADRGDASRARGGRARWSPAKSSGRSRRRRSRT